MFFQDSILLCTYHLTSPYSVQSTIHSPETICIPQGKCDTSQIQITEGKIPVVDHVRLHAT